MFQGIRGYGGPYEVIEVTALRCAVGCNRTLLVVIRTGGTGSRSESMPTKCVPTTTTLSSLSQRRLFNVIQLVVNKANLIRVTSVTFESLFSAVALTQIVCCIVFCKVRSTSASAR